MILPGFRDVIGALACVLLCAGTATMGRDVGDAAHSQSRPGVGPMPSGVSEERLVQLLERSEAGDVDALRAARATAAHSGLRAVVDVRLAAARLDLPGTRAARRVAEARGLPAKWRAITLATEAGAAFADGDYALAARDSAAWLALPTGTDPIHARGDVAQMAAIAAQLALRPRQRTSTSLPASSRAWLDKASLMRTEVRIDGVQQEVVVDTGANLSVVSESAAARLGLVTIDGGSVRSSSRDAVAVRITVARRLVVAGTSLVNVAFLVLKDADLRLPLPGGYDIPAIIGLPVLRVLGQVTFTPTSLDASSLPRLARPGSPLVASGSDLFVMGRVNGVDVPLHLDSGASTTSLGMRFADAHPDAVRGLTTRSTRSAGAGGATEGRAYVLRDALVEVGGASLRLPSLDIDAPDATSTGEGRFGTLGQDMLRAGGGAYTIDFTRMTLSIGRTPPVGS